MILRVDYFAIPGASSVRSFKMLKCTSCPHLQFSTSAERDVHNRTNHQQTCRVGGRDGARDIAVHISDALEWHCPYPSCTSRYKSVNGIQKHYRDKHSSNSPESIPRRVPHRIRRPTLVFRGRARVARTSEEAQGVETPEILKRANLIVVEYGHMTLLVCTTCYVTIDGSRESTVRNHVRNDFGDVLRGGLRRVENTWGPQEDASLSTTIASIAFTPLDEVKEFFRTQPGSVAPVPGLAVQSGFSCSLCNYHSSEWRTMRNHKRGKHTGASNFLIIPKSVQCLVRGLGQHFFPVQHPDNQARESNEDLRSALSKSIASIERRVRAEREPPARELCPWLRLSEWSRYAAKMIPEGTRFRDVKDAMLLSDPNEAPYSRLSTVVRLYLKKVLDENSEFDWKVREMVMPEDSTVGFKRFLNESTMKKYCPVMTGLLLALLRSACDPPSNVVRIVKAPDYLKENLREFKTQLESLPQGSIEDFDYSILHKLLLSIWTPPLSAKVQTRKSVDCVFLQYMILYTLIPAASGESPSYAWKNVREVTPMLSILKYWCRATMTLEIGRKQWDPSTEEDLDFVEVERLVLVYLNENPRIRDTPFGFVCSMQRLACTIAGDQETRPNLVSSDPDNTWCAINGYLITLDSFRGLVKAVVRDCTTLMEQDVLLGLNTDWLEELLEPGGVIVDDLNKKRDGYSFITDERNPFIQHKDDLTNHLFASATTRYVQDCDGPENMIWNPKALSRLMAACGEMEDRLYLLLHLASGQPARGSEYQSLLVQNTTTNERSFFWSDETLVVHQSYNKAARPVKHIVRFLPSDLRLLFLQYFCLVRPTQLIVASILWDDRASGLYRDCWFVNCGRRNAPTRLSNSLSDEFTKHCNAPIRLRHHRHLAKFFSEPIRRLCKSMSKDLLDAQTGHSTEIGGRCYAQNKNDKRSVSRQQWREYRFCSLHYAALLHLRQPLQIDRNQHTEPVPQPGVTTARPYPGVEVEFITPGPRPTKRIRILQACDDQSRGHNTELDGVDPHAMHDARIALAKLGHSDWKIPQQAVAVALAVDNTKDFLAILPTGAGKSAIFKAAAQSSGKTVVIVVPLFMLIKSQIAECSAANISCAEYRPDAPILIAEPSLVFVPVEIAIGNQFQGWAKQLIIEGKLHSIFIDEIHLALCSYRPKMRQLLLLSAMNCPLVGLTASLPPYKEERLKILFNRRFTVIRSPTTRPNLEYRVVEAADIDLRIAESLQTWMDNADPRDRALVYCMMTHEVGKLQEYLQRHSLESSGLHSQMSPEDKLTNLQTWEAGNRKIMVATSVIGCGYDYAFIRLVIHRGGFYTMEDFHQESGRCGRDGREGVCEVVSHLDYRNWFLKLLKDKNTEEDTINGLMQANDWIASRDDCRRYNLHKEMDGKAGVCVLLPGGVECDVCSARSEIARSGTRCARNRATDAGQRWGCGQAFGNTQPEVYVPRPDSIRMEKDLRSDIADLHYVRDHAGNGSRCLLCLQNPRTLANHSTEGCPKVSGKCFRCSSPDHRASECGVKMGNERLQHAYCYRCYFQLDPIGDVRVHKGSPNMCNDLSGERIRTLAWYTYRDRHKNAQLRRSYPRMPFEDTQFEHWLMSIEEGRMAAFFIRVGASALRMKLSHS